MPDDEDCWDSTKAGIGGSLVVKPADPNGSEDETDEFTALVDRIGMAAFGDGADMEALCDVAGGDEGLVFRALHAVKKSLIPPKGMWCCFGEG